MPVPLPVTSLTLHPLRAAIMALLAVVFGVLSVVVGLYASLYWDLPSGPLIVVTAALFFGLAQAWPQARHGSAVSSSDGPTGEAAG